MNTCPACGAANHIVNQCRCDPRNLPTRVPGLKHWWARCQHSAVTAFLLDLAGIALFALTVYLLLKL